MSLTALVDLAREDAGIAAFGESGVDERHVSEKVVSCVIVRDPALSS